MEVAIIKQAYVLSVRDPKGSRATALGSVLGRLNQTVLVPLS
jgi:hypothetical protein